MDADERRHLEDLLQTYQRRLRHLEKQSALFGPRTPPDILMEIEDIKGEIKRTALQLKDLAGNEEDTGLVSQRSSDIKREPRQFPSELRPIYQLRAPLPDFIGRHQERRLLIEALSTEDSNIAIICGIHGMGGLGKTELAIIVAHAVKETYADGQIFISMQSGTGRPRRAEDGLKEVISLFHDRGGPMSEGVDGLASLYRGYLNNKRILIILDDVLNTTTARPFLPPSGCALLVTSRERIYLDGQHLLLNLDAISDSQARKLLLSLAPRLKSDKLLGELLKRCGNLPLAVRVVGQTLMDRDDLTLAQYIERLDQEKNRITALKYADRDVYAILGVSDDLIEQENPILSRRWRMLHIFSKEFTKADAKMAWGVQEDSESADALAELRRRSLVNYDRKSQHYHLHDLLRDIASYRCDPEDAAAAIEPFKVHIWQLKGQAKRMEDLANKQSRHIRNSRRHYMLGTEPGSLRRHQAEQIRWQIEQIKELIRPLLDSKDN